MMRSQAGYESATPTSPGTDLRLYGAPRQSRQPLTLTQQAARHNIGLNRSDFSMLRLSKKADYALMAMKHLASDAPHGAASAREIAERYDIPLELLAKVLQQLTRHGLLASHMGIHGGYHLARPTAAISVAEIIEAIDGPLAITACG